MKKKIISIVGLALFVGAIFYNFQVSSLDSRQLDGITLKNIKALTASAEESDPDTYPDKSPVDRTETTTTYYKVEVSGNVIVVDASAEWTYKTTTTDNYTCCQDGGSDCSTSHVLCD